VCSCCSWSTTRKWELIVHTQGRRVVAMPHCILYLSIAIESEKLHLFAAPKLLAFVFVSESELNWKVGFLKEAFLQAHRMKPDKREFFTSIISLYS
jgi:hypothetical protein